MTSSRDPTDAIGRKVMMFPGVGKGASCTQRAFKTGKGTILFIGPGAKRVAFKSMFKLGASMSKAQKLATQHPKRFEVGMTGWVIARFTAGQLLPIEIWGRWLAESHEVTCGGDRTAKRSRRTN